MLATAAAAAGACGSDARAAVRRGAIATAGGTSPRATGQPRAAVGEDAARRLPVDAEPLPNGMARLSAPCTAPCQQHESAHY
jgi:hypothetical protein